MQGFFLNIIVIIGFITQINWASNNSIIVNQSPNDREDYSKTSPMQSHSIFDAIENDDYEAVKKILDENFDPNTCNLQSGMTPLMYLLHIKKTDLAICNEKIFHLLLNHKNNNVNFRNKINGSTAICYAASNHISSDALKLLIRAGADLDIQFKGNTPLMLSIIFFDTEKSLSRCNFQQSLVELALKKVHILVQDGGADITIKNAKGQTAYDFALKRKIKPISDYLEKFMIFLQQDSGVKFNMLYDESESLKDQQSIFCWYFNQALRNKNAKNIDLNMLYKIYAHALKNEKNEMQFKKITDHCDKEKLKELERLYHMNTFEQFDIGFNYLN